jgi:predicted transcriptional regulator
LNKKGKRILLENIVYELNSVYNKIQKLKESMSDEEFDNSQEVEYLYKELTEKGLILWAYR